MTRAIDIYQYIANMNTNRQEQHSNIVSVLSHRIHMPDIKALATLASTSTHIKDLLWELANSADRQTSVNALWVMTHMIHSDADWLLSLQNDLIDMLLSQTDHSKKRLLLKILREQEFDSQHIRVDFLDFCLSKINSEYEQYATRAFCIYIAFKMCKLYAELLAELKGHLSMLSLQPLQPGLLSALRKTLTDIKKIEK